MIFKKVGNWQRRNIGKSSKWPWKHFTISGSCSTFPNAYMATLGTKDWYPGKYMAWIFFATYRPYNKYGKRREQRKIGFAIKGSSPAHGINISYPWRLYTPRVPVPFPFCAKFDSETNKTCRKIDKEQRTNKHREQGTNSRKEKERRKVRG